jgi:hypothetical protein
MEKRRVEAGIREESKTISDALTHLQGLGYVVLDLTSSNCIISIPTHMRKDAFRIIYPGFLVDSEVAMEDQIPEHYDNTPIFAAEAEKEIHREISEYWFCAKKSRPDYVACFVFNNGLLKYRIALGSLKDFGSLVSQALREIDNLFGKERFSKADLAHKLPHRIVRNRQPIKAVTEYLCRENYLIRLDGSNFQRTGKIHKIDTLDEIEYYRKIGERKTYNRQSIDTVGIRYGYTDEEGLYPSSSDPKIVYSYLFNNNI